MQGIVNNSKESEIASRCKETISLHEEWLSWVALMLVFKAMGELPFIFVKHGQVVERIWAGH